MLITGTPGGSGAVIDARVAVTPGETLGWWSEALATVRRKERCTRWGSAVAAEVEK